MHSRFHRNIAALIAAPLVLGGCVQMTRHSNTMLFGTNTSLGLKVGTDATSVPGILVGYNRQEAVVLPLVANTASHDVGKSNVLEPCNVGNEVKVVAGNPAPNGKPPLPAFVTHPCLLVATGKDKDTKDSYSVLASFGANFGAAGQADKVTAQGGIAQYFATGMAAQLLAYNGGASVVATGPAATKSAEVRKMTLGGVPSTDEQVDGAKKWLTSYQKWIGGISAQMDDPSNTMAALKTQMAAFETSLGQTEPLTPCSTVKECAASAVAKNWHASDYDAADSDRMNKAATAGWPNFKPGD